MAKYDISNIDANFRISTNFEEKDMRFFSVRQKPFKVYGLFNVRDSGPFKRLPVEIAKATSDGVESLNFNTAGGRVRFSTDSEYIAIKAVVPQLNRMPNMALSGSSGFDMYADGAFCKAFIPPLKVKDDFELIHHFPSRRMRNIEINFPLYNSVGDLFVGVSENAQVAEGAKYRFDKHIVYYNSSITQGGCASRPGNSYQAIISRKLDCNYINFGFSGSARGEDAIVNYMAELDMSVFVCDYDHNAPSVEHLEVTHEKLFQRIRERNRDVSVIIVTKPDFDTDIDDAVKHRNVIYRTYMNAVSAGDKNVYFIDGRSLFSGEYRDCCTVDGCHPNDAGFVRMADVIGKEIEKCLKGVQRI